MQLVDDLRAGREVRPTRGADSVCGFKQMSRVLAGFNDGRADEGVGAGPASVQGLRIASGEQQFTRTPAAPAPAADDEKEQQS